MSIKVHILPITFWGGVIRGLGGFMEVTIPTSELAKFLKELNSKRDTIRINIKRGRPLTYSDEVILRAMVVMVLARINTIKGLHKYLAENPEVCKSCGFEKLPSRVTLLRRFKEVEKQVGLIR